MALEFTTSYIKDSLAVFRQCKQLAERAMEQVTDKQLFAVIDPESNSIAIVVKHMAGNMRRLIETIMNKHVFADSRQQYKQRSQAVSEFNKFTQLVPLLPAEALELKDLFGKLSKTEHDDDRNSYVNTDKAVFKTRYTRIKQIESDIVARK